MHFSLSMRAISFFFHAMASDGQARKQAPLGGLGLQGELADVAGRLEIRRNGRVDPDVAERTGHCAG